jgi:hypothetical protein
MPKCKRIAPPGYIPLKQWAHDRGLDVSTVSTWVNAARVDSIRKQGRWFIKDDSHIKRAQYAHHNLIIEEITIRTVDGDEFPAFNEYPKEQS